MYLDDYSLDKSLGKGAFGEVFLTTKKGTKKLFATKKIERNIVENANMKYFVNEVHVLRELDHPNIAKYEEIKKTKNHYYIIMEYCNGGELYKALEKYMEKHNNKPFTQEIVQHLMRQIINAFKYIHGKNIIHRDIKLENILLNYESEEDKKNMNLMKAQVKIIDFGFAAKIEKDGLKYTTLGSPINMDPIILNELKKRGKKTRKLGYDQKADIWSLGTICYEMLIGKCVFNAEDLDELIEKVENGTYTVPTTLSKEVISFLNGMLQYDGSMRLNIEQLSNHSFLTKNVKDFESIDLKKISKNVDKNNITINVKKNKSIWAIFNKEDEDKLIKISAQCFDKPIDEQKNVNINNLDNNNQNNKNIKNNKPTLQNNNNQNNIKPNIKNDNNNQNNNKTNNQNNNKLNNNKHNNQNDNKHNNNNNKPNNQNNNNKQNNNNIQNNNKHNLHNNNMDNKNNIHNKHGHNSNKNNNNNIQNNNIKNNNYINNFQNNNRNNNNLNNNNQQQIQNNQYNNINNNTIPIVNMAYGYNSPNNYPLMPAGYGYQGVQGMPPQRMVGVPLMAYPQMQPIQGYGIPTGYAYANTGYYK